MRVIGRNTQGVRMINLNAGEKVVDIDKLAEGYEEEEDQEGRRQSRAAVTKNNGKIAVIGAGSWGTALALLLCRRKAIR